jgi:hypothetical protein
VLPGLQKTSALAIADTLRRDPEGVREGLRKLLREGLLEQDEKRRVIRIPNAPKHNPAESPNHIRAWFARWQEIPDCALKFAHIEALRQFAHLEKPSHLAA